MNSIKSKDPLLRSNQEKAQDSNEASAINLDALPISRESQIIAPMYSTRIGKARHQVRMEPRLVVISGANRGLIVWLDKDEVVIGRDPLCTLRLNDDAISRKQCTVKAADGSFLVVDFESRNGSFVNGVPIREKVLRHGDQIRVGGTELLFLSDAEPPVLPVPRDEDKAIELTNRISYPAEKRSMLNVSEPDKIAPRQSVPPIPIPIAPALANRISPDRGTRLHRFTKVITRQRGKLLVFVGFAMVAAVVFQLVSPKVYEAAALIKVEHHAAAGITGSETSPVASSDDMNQIITTQIEMAQSDPALRPVVEQYNLLPARKQTSSDGNEHNDAAPIALKSLKVTHPPDSHLIRVTYRANDPQLAANIANAVAQSLIDHANATRESSYEEISSVVAQDLSELRSKMEASANRLAQYEKELKIADPQQRAAMQASRITLMETEFTAAQAERIRREAILAQVDSSDTLASAQAAQAAAQDTLLSEAVQRLNVVRQQFTSVRSYYGEGHPEYVKAQKQVQEVQAQVDELRSRAKERATAEYRQAQGRESRLLGLLQQSKAEGNSLTGHAQLYEQLKSEADNDKKNFQDLTARTRLASINRLFQNATFQIVAKALVPQDAIFPKPLVVLPLALILAAIFGILIALLASALDTTFSDSEEIESRLDIDVLASLPAAGSLPSLSPKDAAATITGTSKRSAELTACYQEAVRTLRAALNLALSSRPTRSLLITSAVPGEGKSTIAAHLAVACAQLGKKVLLIDANLRRPTLDKTFKVAATLGFSDVFMGKRPHADAIVKLDQPGLFLMPAGAASRGAVDLVGIGFPALLAKVSREFDLVIVDAPPILAASETLELARVADGVLLVTKAAKTGTRLVSKTMSALLRARANVIGLVMNQVKPSHVDAYPCHHLEPCQANAAPRLGAAN
jgi:capsular exopolysaccharide synthesis family protein